MLRHVTQILKIHRKPGLSMDKYGNPAFAPVEEWETMPWPVYGLGPEIPEEEYAGGREPVNLTVNVYAPLDGPAPFPGDMVTIPSIGGAPFRCETEVARFEANPHFGYTANKGLVVKLSRERR